MKPFLTTSILAVLLAPLLAFTVPTPFSKQVAAADAVARIVVVEIATLDYSETESWGFGGLAKCRVVTDYTSSFQKTDFVYIPCSYQFDEDPSPLYVGEDCIVCLETMKHASVAHPVSYDAVHEITGGKLLDPQSKDSDAWVSVAEFEAVIESHLTKKSERAGADQPATVPGSKPESDSEPQPGADGRSR